MCTFTSGGFKGGEVRAGAIIGTLMHPTAQTGHRRLLQRTEQGQLALTFPGILRQSAHTDKRFTVIFFFNLFIYLFTGSLALAEELPQEP